AYVLIGFGLILSGQAFINLGVNAGLLPTKGLTLPFISYGGSSLLVCCAMLGMMLRLSHELERTKTVSGRAGYER
ncbi:MAG: FtsW/RodA/SpoVE family cell cycle protein, partial [Porticoccaceae bacterium]